MHFMHAFFKHLWNHVLANRLADKQDDDCKCLQLRNYVNIYDFQIRFLRSLLKLLKSLSHLIVSALYFLRILYANGEHASSIRDMNMFDTKDNGSEGIFLAWNRSLYYHVHRNFWWKFRLEPFNHRLNLIVRDWKELPDVNIY